MPQDKNDIASPDRRNFLMTAAAAVVTPYRVAVVTSAGAAVKAVNTAQDAFTAVEARAGARVLGESAEELQPGTVARKVIEERAVRLHESASEKSGKAVINGLETAGLTVAAGGSLIYGAVNKILAEEARQDGSKEGPYL